MVTLLELVGADDFNRLQKSARDVQRVENQWLDQLELLRKRIAVLTMRAIEAGTEPDIPIAMLEEFFVLNAMAAWACAITNEPVVSKAKKSRPVNRLARPRKNTKEFRMPRTMQEVRALYDAIKAKRIVPVRQRAFAQAVRKLYLKKVAEVVARRLEPIKAGNLFDRDAIAANVAKAVGVVYSRAKTIVETETTRNFNGARRAIYDASPDVTHYLFVALRDMATTPWCKSRQGLVYKKGDPLLDDETPPIHWQCRSELLPLTPQNPAHLRLIRDPSRDRRKHRCVPLPAGWATAHAA